MGLARGRGAGDLLPVAPPDWIHRRRCRRRPLSRGGALLGGAGRDVLARQSLGNTLAGTGADCRRDKAARRGTDEHRAWHAGRVGRVDRAGRIARADVVRSRHRAACRSAVRVDPFGVGLGDPAIGRSDRADVPAGGTVAGDDGLSTAVALDGGGRRGGGSAGGPVSRNQPGILRRRGAGVVNTRP